VVGPATMLYPAVLHDVHTGRGPMAEEGPSKRSEAARKAAATKGPKGLRGPA
jgi:hypothetical protein